MGTLFPCHPPGGYCPLLLHPPRGSLHKGGVPGTGTGETRRGCGCSGGSRSRTPLQWERTRPRGVPSTATPSPHEHPQVSSLPPRPDSHRGDARNLTPADTAPHTPHMMPAEGGWGEETAPKGSKNWGRAAWCSQSGALINPPAPPGGRGAPAGRSPHLRRGKGRGLRGGLADLFSC